MAQLVRLDPIRDQLRTVYQSAAEEGLVPFVVFWHQGVDHRDWATRVEARTRFVEKARDAPLGMSGRVSRLHPQVVASRDDGAIHVSEGGSYGDAALVP